MGTFAKKKGALYQTISSVNDVRLTWVNLAVQAPPLRRVLVLRVDVFQGNREMHQEKIEVLDAPKPKLMLRNFLCAVLLVERIPELRSNDFGST